ncbi:hypothetical protein OVA29_07780 [Exiguobacterium sp. SL14]|nr:hypothetical protein [Exiguobacterium sp. SL14]MCY1690610.1 hypothetical protein [Exiguobacterium sp. SL14]
MKRELYVRFAMCQVPYTIVQLIEQFGIVPSHELPVSKRLRNRYEQALHLEQIEESILVKGDPLFRHDVTYDSSIGLCPLLSR